MTSPLSHRYQEDEQGVDEPYNSSGLDLSYVSLSQQLSNVRDRATGRFSPLLSSEGMSQCADLLESPHHVQARLGISFHPSPDRESGSSYAVENGLLSPLAELSHSIFFNSQPINNRIESECQTDYDTDYNTKDKTAIQFNDPDSDKENIPPTYRNDRSPCRASFFNMVAHSSNKEFFGNLGGSQYISRQNSFEDHMVQTREAIDEELKRSGKVHNPKNMSQAVDYDSEAETDRGGAVSPSPRGGKMFDLHGIPKLRLTHRAKEVLQKMGHGGGLSSVQKRVRVRIDSESDSEEPPKKKHGRKPTFNDSGFGEGDDSASDVAPSTPRKVKVVKYGVGGSNSSSPPQTPESESSPSEFASARRNARLKSHIYTPKKNFVRGPRPQFSPGKGNSYTVPELNRIKAEYETYMHDHPDDKTRLHSEHLGWYIADVLYEKYGMNRTGNAIKLCYQRWIRGVLTNLDDRRLSNQNAKKLRTSLQTKAAKRAAAAASKSVGSEMERDE